MKITRSTSTDERDLVRVIFMPHDPDPNRTAPVEVVYEVESAGGSNILNLISVTRQDTKETLTLTKQQRAAILFAISEFLNDEDDSPMWGD